MSRMRALDAWLSGVDTLLAENAEQVREAEQHLAGTVYLTAVHQARFRTEARRRTR